MKRILFVILAGLVVVQTALAAKRAADTTTSEDIAGITSQLATADAKTLAATVEQIRALLEREPQAAAGQLRNGWIVRLTDIGAYDSANDLAIAAIVEVASDTGAVEELQRLRVRTLLAAGRRMDALAASKGLFNVASTSGTRSALQTVMECLAAAYPDDPAVLTRFRREQLEGATLQSTTKPASSTLAAIHIAPAPLAAGIARQDTRRYAIRVQPFRAAVAYANMLLLADRVDEAREVLEQARKVADETQQLELRQGIARSLKAQAGVIGPGNAYLATLRR
jgi:hypothetical protein